MTMRWIPLLAALAVVATPGSASAETNWSPTLTFYGWFPGVSTTIETPVGVVESEIDFDEVLEDLDIAFFGAFEARKGRVSLVGDLQYIDIGAEGEPPAGALFSDVEVDSKIFLVSAYATYALVQTADTQFDVGAGLRYIDESTETNLNGVGATPDASFSRDGGWADMLVAARVTRQFNDSWHGVAYADVGGFGIGDSSDLTWQASAGVGYRFNETWSAVGGYRHLSIERAFNSFDVTVDVSGPYLGFQAKF